MLSSQKIKEVALQLFCDRGYEGTSLADIAELVGIKKSSIYNHYKNKDDLFLHIFEYCCQEELRIRKKEMESRDSSTTLKQFVDHSKHHILNNVAARFAFRFTLFPPYHVSDQLAPKINDFFKALHSIIFENTRRYPENEHLSEQELFDLTSHYILLLKGTFTDQLNHQFTNNSPFTEAAWEHFNRKK